MEIAMVIPFHRLQCKKVLSGGILLLMLAGNACGNGGNDIIDTDLNMTAADFECILEWNQVGIFYLTNKVGNLEAALEVANDPDGGIYPPGTIIQLIPTEAMVKRIRGWNPTTNDWEFFQLNVTADGTEIISRGAEETENFMGLNCFDCHAQAGAEHDFICGDDRCDALSIEDAAIVAWQEADPRCQ